MPPIRSALYLPAWNERALSKARNLPADMILLDLEDSVKDPEKVHARTAAVAAVEVAFNKPVGIRVNGVSTPWHEADLAAVRSSASDFVVLPKAETVYEVVAVTRATRKPVLAMIETPRGVLAAPNIAAVEGVAGLIAGTNDLAAELRLPAKAGREGLSLALQSIVLAARSSGGIALDGVFNSLEDEAGLVAEAKRGRELGFDGKTLIHPSQIGPVNRAFAPTDEELEDARALVAAATGGAERFRGRMIETMHVTAAMRLLAQDSP